jgi:ketosteroid isomerase-like protein
MRSCAASSPALAPIGTISGSSPRASPTSEGAVSFGRYTGTFRRNGRQVDAQFAHVWTIAGGRIKGFQQYTDTAQFSRAITA